VAPRLVAAAAATVAVLMLRSPEAPARAAARTSHDAAPAKPPAAKAFLPPELPIAATEASADAQLTVHVANDWAPSEVIHVWTQTRDRFDRFVKDKAVTAEVPAPLTIVIVPSRTLCDVRTFENGVAPPDCSTLGSYYRPLDLTLLVVDDRPHLDVNLGVGMATAACLREGADPRACDVIDPFEQLLRGGS
jgi:hypothetical protein